MSDYKESTVAGTSWQRCVRVVIENPYGAGPSINFVEEKAVNLGDGVLTNLCGNVSTQFDAQNAEHVAIYTALNNLYMALAQARDAAQEA